MPNKFASYTNEELVDHFDLCCVECCKAVNFDPRKEKRANQLYEEARAELLRRLNNTEGE